MTFTLASYQHDAVEGVLAELRDAQRAYSERGKKTAVGLTAPTGAGKTVMASAILERLLFGDEDTPANRDLAVLWVTDDPALNRQTADKMMLASPRLADSLVFLDDSFDAKRLERGRIHFCNIQKLGVASNSAWPGRDQREHGLWDTLATTVEDYGANFLLVIDEAHRGTESNTDDTIVERLSHGGTYPTRRGERTPLKQGIHPAAPVILGITATPDRFKKSMDRRGRSLEDVEVDVAQVRESGLLKDRIVVRHPGEKQPSHETLLGLAVDALRSSDQAWQAQYEAAATDGNPARRVYPLLVIQVAPGTDPSDLAPMLAALEAQWTRPDGSSVLAGSAVAHAFQEQGTLTVPSGPAGDREVQKVSPDRIADRTDVRVVFFKNALTTGWDCPRAEVMLSLRSAEDFTNIAQLIGRMVRTPLAERIETPGLDTATLNSVSLYLPHYNRANVARVVAALGDETDGDVEVAVEPVECLPREGVPGSVWERLAALPSAARAKKPFSHETARLLELARLLRGHDLVEDANAQARARLLGALRTEEKVRASEVEKALGDVTTLDMTETVYDYRRDELVETDSDAEPAKVEARAGDVTAQFKAAVRVLPDAIAKWYWDEVCEQHPDMDPYDSQARVAALVKTPELAEAMKAAVESAATEQIKTWRSQYANKVAMLAKPDRMKFEAVWAARRGILSVDLEVPSTVSAPTERIVGTGDEATTKPVPTWTYHLFVAPDGNGKIAAAKFPARLTGWEEDVLKAELDQASLVGWYRNPPRSRHGLAVPYDAGDEPGLLYPDFLFFHQDDDGETMVDLIDPHQHNDSYTGPKWAGLARWAAEHAIDRGGDRVRRVVAVIKVKDGLRALDLTQDNVAEQLDACTTQAHIEKLFGDVGGAY